MAVTRTTLIARFPEFTAAAEDLVNASIADATLMVDTVYYGAKADMAITYKAAHLIAMNPLGEMARINKRTGVATTTYEQLFKDVMKSIGTGFRVI